MSSGPVAVDGHAHRPGVRHGHRDGVDPRHQVDVQLLDDPDDGAGEPLPLQVRLEPGQEEERASQPVDQPVEGQARRLVVLQVVFDEADVRAPGPVVDQLVGVEHGDHLRVEGVQQFGGDLLDHVAGVGESGESHHQVEPAQCRAVEQLGVAHVVERSGSSREPEIRSSTACSFRSGGGGGCVSTGRRQPKQQIQWHVRQGIRADPPDISYNAPAARAFRTARSPAVCSSSH